MIVGLKKSIPCDHVISRNNNYGNYLNERKDTHLIFYLSEWALIRSIDRSRDRDRETERKRERGVGGLGRSFKPRRSLNFLAVKRGAHWKGALFQIITVMLPS